MAGLAAPIPHGGGPSTHQALVIEVEEEILGLLDPTQP